MAPHVPRRRDRDAVRPRYRRGDAGRRHTEPPGPGGRIRRGPMTDASPRHPPTGAPPAPALEIVRLEQRESFITADGSSIRELAGLPSGNAANQSLAEATVPAGGATVEHF